MSTASGDGDRRVRRVLVVDDTESKRYVIASWLRRAGFEVVEEATGGAAVARAVEAGVHLVVLDVHLPDVDGLEVCRRLRADPATTGIPVMHISGVAIESDDRSLGLEQGADAYLAEPIEPRELVATARALLRYYEARHDAERLAARLGRLTVATLRINQALNLPRLLAAAAEAAGGLFDAAAVALAGSPREGWTAWGHVPTRGHRAGTGAAVEVPAEVVARVAGGLQAPEEVTVPAGSSWDALVRQDGAPDDPGAAADGVEGCRTGLEWTLVPVRGGGSRQPAALAVHCAGSRSADERVMLRHLARSVSVAMDNLRAYAEEHSLALTLQRSLVPEALPDLPGLGVQARYQASSDVAEIGGDFFDAFQLDDGAALVVIGDVQGHSLAAAMIMAELRYSVRAYAHDGHGPEAVVERLNRRLLREQPDYTATVCLVRVAPDRRSARVVNAGHLPPLLVEAGGAQRFVVEHGPLLGIPAEPPSGVDVPLAPGDRLVLVTDGLVERRDRHLEVGLRALSAAVGDHRDADLRRLADMLMRDLAGGGDDDVALVAVEVTRGPAGAVTS